MSLEQDIFRQYSGRENKHRLYSGRYTDFVFAEKKRRLCRQLTGKEPGKSTILEIGAGNGSNIALLEACGFRRENIFLNELLPDRVEQINRNFPDTVVFPGNAIELDFGRRFDFVFQSTVFTSLLKDEHRRALAEKMDQLLVPGGYVIWYDFIYNNPRNADVRKVSLAELKQLFPAYTLKSGRVTLAPPIGRRVGKLYPLFNIVPLRSHILALLRKPLRGK